MFDSCVIVVGKYVKCFFLFICKKKTLKIGKNLSVFLGLGFGFRYDPLLSCCTINTLRFIVRCGGRHNYNLCPRWWWWSPTPPPFPLQYRLLSRQCRPEVPIPVPISSKFKSVFEEAVAKDKSPIQIAKEAESEFVAVSVGVSGFCYFRPSLCQLVCCVLFTCLTIAIILGWIESEHQTILGIWWTRRRRPKIVYPFGV